MMVRVVNGTEIKASRDQEIIEEFPIHRGRNGLTELARVRRYRASDRERIRQLCCDTGFLGNPVDGVFQDRELFADLFTKAYLDYEPEWALVAEVDGRVVGYLLGSVSRRFEFMLLRSGFQTASKMLYRFATGMYSKHPRSGRFVRWLLISGFREQPKHPANAAHLHLDLQKPYRGRGIGVRLWEIFAQRLKAAGIRECYGAFFSCERRRPESVYARYGFSVFDRRQTTLFQPEIPNPIEVVCVTKQL